MSSLQISCAKSVLFGLRTTGPFAFLSCSRNSMTVYAGPRYCVFTDSIVAVLSWNRRRLVSCIPFRNPLPLDIAQPSPHKPGRHVQGCGTCGWSISPSLGWSNPLPIDTLWNARYSSLPLSGTSLPLTTQNHVCWRLTYARVNSST